MMSFYRAAVSVLLTASIGWPAQALAQTQPQWQPVTIKIYVFNSKDNSPVPGRNVYYDETHTRCGETPGQRGTGLHLQNFASGVSGPDGIVELTVQACPGEATISVNGGGFDFFYGHREAITIEPGVQTYDVDMPLEPKPQRSKLNSNKFLNPKTRTLHIIVKGKVGNKLLPVHYATIYDMQGRKVATTNYQGIAVVQHKEVMGETVTLRAVAPTMPGNNEAWEEATASFIVGAAESGLRTTRAEDYVNIVLNGNNSNSEKHQLSVLVRGINQSKKNQCRCVRVPGAAIVDEQGRVLGHTDSNGMATVTVEAPLGETYTVKAEAQHWKPGTERLQSGASSAIGTLAHESVDFMLEPSQEHGNLTVEVLDHETNKPVGSATVTLYKPNRFPGTQIAEATTDHKGEVTFSAQDIDEAMLNGEARVGAVHGGAKAEAQTISESLVSGDVPRYVLYLKQKTEKTNWSGTWYDGPYVIQVSGGSGSLGFTAKRADGIGTCCPLTDDVSGSCTVKGSEATCKWQGHYTDIPPTNDGGKDVVRSGHGTLRLVHYSGNVGQDSISYHMVQDTGTIRLGSGQPCPDIAQCTGMHPGSVVDGSWSKKKP